MSISGAAQTFTTSNATVTQGAPFSQGSSDLMLFDVYAQDGGNATWDPVATFQYLLVPSGVGGTVPEPGTLALLALGAAGLGFSRRKSAA